MDYLKGHNTASALAMIVAGRFLATRPSGAREDELESCLQPPDDSGLSAALEASLVVGRDLGFFEVAGHRKKDRTWSLCDATRAEFQAASTVNSLPLRVMILRYLGQRARADAEAGDRPSDLALALAWLQLRDSLAPLSTSWGEGPEKAVEDAGMREAIKDREQWRAVMRWANSLGLATEARTKGRTYLLVDPTRAVGQVLDRLPHHGTAERWLDELYMLLPILGDRQLMAQLPAGVVDGQVPPATAIAMLKLEKLGRIRLVASDDARDAVVLRLGGQPRQIGEVIVVDGAQ